MLPSPALPHGLSRRMLPIHILPIPPTPTVFDQRVVDVGAIHREHISKGAPILVLAVGIERDIFPEDQN